MLTFDLTKAEGFEVIHTSIVGNSVWRTAIHAWKEGVNDLTSFQNWGVHEDSEEAFVVLEGGGFLFTSKEGKEDGDYQCCALEMGSQYLVGQRLFSSLFLGKLCSFFGSRDPAVVNDELFSFMQCHHFHFLLILFFEFMFYIESFGVLSPQAMV